MHCFSYILRGEVQSLKNVDTLHISNGIHKLLSVHTRQLLTLSLKQ